MIQDIRNLGLSKQIGIYHLLFSALAVGITVVGMTLNHFYQEVSRQEQRCLPILERTVPLFRMDLLRSEGQGLQTLVDKLQRENDLLFACVTSQDGQFIAHSNPNFVGKSTTPAQGVYRNLGGVTEIRYRDLQGRSIREWRAPIETVSFVGDVRVATPQQGFLGHLLTFDSALLAILIPLLVVGAGSLMLRRITQPLAAVEQQLVHAAKSPLGKPNVEAIEMRSATSLGWNRVVDELGHDEDVIHASLGDRETARWESILDAVPLGIAVTDTEGTVESTNQGFHAYCAGAAAEEEKSVKTIGQQLDANQIHDLLTEPAVRSVSDEFTLGGRELRVVRSRQLQNKTTRGRYVWTIRDMTQQRMTDRLHSQFVDAATHELRTPLANIKAYAETLALADGVKVEDQKEFCNIISTEATRLARFIDDLLDVRSLEVGSMMLSKQSVELGKLIGEAVDKVKPLMDSNELTFTVNQPAKLPEVSLDKDKIYGVLVNLLGNAAKYTPPQGQVEMQVRIEDSMLEVAVRDTGVGISEDEAERVFEKFFRSEDSRVRDEVGTGLGLSIAKEVVELHNGTLTVDSEIDEGTTFTMQIPIS